MKNIDDHILIHKIGVPFAFYDSEGVIKATSVVDISIPGTGISTKRKSKEGLLKICKAQATKAAKQFGLAAKLMTMDEYADWLDTNGPQDEE